MLNVEAHAKINLSLEVVGRRADGYHELVSVMQEVTLADRLQLAPAEGISLTCDEPSIEGADNLAVRAARLFQTTHGSEAGCAIKLEKHIPIAAGLGGGSSNAAAVLRSLVTLWQARTSCAELVHLAAALGSDVPFFLYGGTCLVEGRGERVSGLPSPSPSWYVLTNPGFLVSTTSVFRELTKDKWTSGETTRELAAHIASGGESALGINALQSVLFALYPAAHTCFQHAERHAPSSTMVSGSGPTVISRFADPAEAQAAAAALASCGYWTAVVRTHSRAEEHVLCPSNCSPPS